MRRGFVRGVLGVSIALLAPACAYATPAGTITTIVGGPVLGPAPATSVGVEPTGVASATVGGKAFIYVADQQNHVVRRVEVTTGVEQVVAGGIGGFSGDGGPAVGAGIGDLQGLAVDAGGDLFIADGENDRVRFVPASSGTFFGQAMSAGDVYTIAGDGASGAAGDGGPALGAAISDPEDVALDPAGDLAIADSEDSRVRFVPASSGSFFGQAMTAGDVYTIAGTGSEGFSGDGGLGTAAKLDFPSSVTFDAAGDVVFADSGNNRVRIVTRAASVSGEPLPISSKLPPASPLPIPSISNATQSHRRWREGKALASTARRHKSPSPPLGTTFSFTLNEQAKVSFTFTQRVGGREVKHKCVAQTKRNRRKHACERTVTRGALSFTAHTGTNKVSFQGRISHSLKLRPGTYALLITAVNSLGERSVPKQLTFTIVK
jgi:hypothetical protein